jgi:diketogulonate reductase-like aldo/keto reductase
LIQIIEKEEFAILSQSLLLAIQRKELGKTGVKVPEIGLGTWQYRGGTEALVVGVQLGADLIDTAEIYGTEGIVGQAIREVGRDKVFLATKVSAQHLRYGDVLKAAEGSLKRMNVEQIDLYQVHWANPSVPIEDTMRAMGELLDSGKIRFVGVSNFSVEETHDAQKSLSKGKIVCNQVEYNLSERSIEQDLIPYCVKEGITVMAYSPLAHGNFMQSGSSLLDKIASKYKKTRAQVILNWIISHENVIAIPKSESVEHTRENCGASGWRLSQEDIEKISEMS